MRKVKVTRKRSASPESATNAIPQKYEKTCGFRVIASWLSYDLECVRAPHAIGAHQMANGGRFLAKYGKQQPPPKLKKRVVRIRRKP